MTAHEAVAQLAARRPRAFDPGDALPLRTAGLYDWLAGLAHAAYTGDKLDRVLEDLGNSGLGELHRRQPEIERDARRARRKAARAAREKEATNAPPLLG